MNDWISGCMDEWMNAQANGCMDGCINCHTPFPFPFYPLHPLVPPLNHHPLQPSPHNHPSTPSLRPFKYHSPTGASLPSPSPTANTRNKCRLHQYVCIADVWTPTHFTLLHPPIPAPCRATLFQPAPIQSIPSHPTLVECGQLTSTHHGMRAGMHAGQGRQAGGKANRYATINTHRHAGSRARGQAGKQANMQAGRQECGSTLSDVVFSTASDSCDTESKSLSQGSGLS